jgi:hypothetical protein
MTIQFKKFSNAFNSKALDQMHKFIIDQGIEKEDVVSILSVYEDNRTGFVIWYDDGGRHNMQEMVESWIVYEPLTKEECFEKLKKIYPDKFDQILGAVSRAFENVKGDLLTRD